MTLKDIDKTIETLEKFGLPIDPKLIAERDALRAKPTSETPIYDTMKAHASFPLTKEKCDCIEGTVSDLLADGPNATDPGLLLGRIQCGKTDTFENIIGLAFDRSIDIAVILTKGTNALLDQTVKRLEKDFEPFDEEKHEPGVPVVRIYDIHELKEEGITKSYTTNGQKIIIACMKQATNMDYLLRLFRHKCPFLLEKKVLVVDDEADFASRNYLTVKNQAVTDEHGKPMAQDVENKLAVISRKIDEFRELTKCLYLQVTATPYALFLQPDEELYLKDGHVLSFKPRFTRLVPTHDKYIGGKQFFEESQNDDSMYHELFCAVTPKCIQVLGSGYQRYLTAPISSENILGLTYSLASYLMATAIRNLQEGEEYYTSALFHVDISKDDHEYQKKLIKRLLGDIDAYLKGNNDQRVATALKMAYNSFTVSNQKGVAQGLIDTKMPSLEEVKEFLKGMFDEEHIHVKVVNSDTDVKNMLDKKHGELKLHPLANIYIGGNILDRGITIKNMLCFFYGRDPKTFQTDTVLQHARFYGARNLKDMAVTRLHTTTAIHKILTRMHQLDEDLRRWFEEGKDKMEHSVPCIGYDKGIKPCATSKIKVSHTVSLKPQQRILPVGHQAGKPEKIGALDKEIQKKIQSLPGFKHQDADGIFEISREDAMEILDMIQRTYVYSSKFNNLDAKNDIKELQAALARCVDFSDGKIYALVRENRDMKRIRENGGFVDAPDDGRTDLKPARDKAQTAPVLMFIHENGRKQKGVVEGYSKPVEVGWQGAPFYWPVLVTPANLDKTLFALDVKEKNKAVTISLDDLLQDIDREDVFFGTYSGDLLGHFGPEGTVYEDGEWKRETRRIKKTTASRYIFMTNGEPDTIEEFEKDDRYRGVYSRNEGEFPFILKPWKYMLLRNGRNTTSDIMLLELTDPEEWEVVERPGYNSKGDLVDSYNPYDIPEDKLPVLAYVTDTQVDKNLNKTTYRDPHLTLWQVEYKIKSVKGFKPGFRVSDDWTFADDEEDED